ncbi:MAG: FGGY-family carbohydrate kinase, partial [Bacteroidales bacterium]
CRKQWKERGEELTWPEIQAALSSGCDAGGCPDAGAACRTECSGALINPDDPSFANPKDMEKAIAEYLEIRGEKMPDTRIGIVRLVFESLAARYCEVFGWLRGFAPYELKGLYVIGGGSKNAVLNAYTRAALGVDVVPCLSEATAVGNLKVQRRALAAASL